VFAIVDIETRVDKHLLNQSFFARENLSDQEAYERYREQLRGRDGSDFFPLTLHVPISIAVGNADEDRILRAVESLALTGYSEETLVREFWTRAERFDGCLVTFNGRRFDLPVLELSALRYGIAAPSYFSADDSTRSRHNSQRHLDLYHFLTNYGAVGLRGGMNLLLKMIGMPGKTGLDGSMVQEYFEAGRIEEIHRYCRTDVIQTYFLFLRVELMRGRIDEATYRAACAASDHFLAEIDREPPSAGGEQT
jgi:predicted PolB exonuclease-like 3'-5' exonuclease